MCDALVRKNALMSLKNYLYTSKIVFVNLCSTYLLKLLPAQYDKYIFREIALPLFLIMKRYLCVEFIKEMSVNK